MTTVLSIGLGDLIARCVGHTRNRYSRCLHCHRRPTWRPAIVTTPVTQKTGVDHPILSIRVHHYPRRPPLHTPIYRPANGHCVKFCFLPCEKEIREDVTVRPVIRRHSAANRGNWEFVVGSNSDPMDYLCHSRDTNFHRRYNKEGGRVLSSIGYQNYGIQFP